MSRVERDEIWDKTSLDDYKTEDIEPVNIAGEDGTTYIPETAQDIHTALGNWAREAFKRTQRTGNEHGFYVDYYGNVIGLYEGDSDSITFPDEHKANRVCTVHTHPENPVFSNTDIDSLEHKANLATEAIIDVNLDSRDGIIIALNKTDEFSTNTGDSMLGDYSRVANGQIHNYNYGPISIVSTKRDAMKALLTLGEKVNDEQARSGKFLELSYRELELNPPG